MFTQRTFGISAEHIQRLSAAPVNDYIQVSPCVYTSAKRGLGKQTLLNATFLSAAVYRRNPRGFFLSAKSGFYIICRILL